MIFLWNKKFEIISSFVITIIFERRKSQYTLTMFFYIEDLLNLLNWGVLQLLNLGGAFDRSFEGVISVAFHSSSPNPPLIRIKPHLLIMAYKATPHLRFTSFNLSLCSTHTGLLSFLRYADFVLSLGLWQFLCLLLGVFFPQVFAWLPPSCHSDLYSNVTPHRCLFSHPS